MSKRKGHLKAWHVLISVVVIIMVATCGFLLWSYKPEVVALDALCDTHDVRVTNNGKQIVFEPVADVKAGIIFYPGANVDARAYAPLMKELANRGILVVIAVMPHEMAFLDSNAADLILEEYGSLTDKWYISGHSLGGSMAGTYLSKNPDKLDGIILLAAYSTDNINYDGISSLTIYGSKDYVLNLGRLDKYISNLPADSDIYVIKGGNHANFAYYGNQFGDGDATISKEDQIQETANVIEEFIDSHGS